MVIELCVVQFWSEIILVISNQTCAARSFDFEIMRIISDQIARHSVPLPLLIIRTVYKILLAFPLYHYQMEAGNKAPRFLHDLACPTKICKRHICNSFILLLTTKSLSHHPIKMWSTLTFVERFVCINKMFNICFLECDSQ